MKSIIGRAVVGTALAFSLSTSLPAQTNSPPTVGNFYSAKDPTCPLCRLTPILN